MDYFFKYVKLNNTFCTIKQEKNAQNSKFFYLKNLKIFLWKKDAFDCAGI